MLKNGSGKTIIYFLLLLWLALTGSYEGWQIPVLLTINGYLSAIVLIWGGWSLARNGEKPLTRPLIAFWLAGVLISALAGDPASVVRIFIYAILIALYHIPHDLETLRRAARPAGWIIIPLAIVAPWENGNSMAMVIWGLYWLGVGGPLAWLYTILAVSAVVVNSSDGGALALLAGAAVWAWLRWPAYRQWMAKAFAIGAVTVITVVLAIKVNYIGSFWKRVGAYQQAWAGFVHSPLIGNGLNTFDVWVGDWHAISEHNLILTVLWEMGLVGLIISAWLIYRLIARHQFAPWAGAWLATFACHSLVDQPLFSSFFSAAILFIILGGLPCREKITLAWPWPRRWPWPWPARLSLSRRR